ncbi:MAG: ATP-dependent Clp protease proteolytic subunit [Pseudomonadota bacterium]
MTGADMNAAIAKYVLGSLEMVCVVSQLGPSIGAISSDGKRIETIGNVKVYQTAESEQGKGIITLRWRGQIDEKMGPQMVKALKKYRSKTDHFIIDISSQGGYVNSGEVLIDYMKKLKSGHTIDTRVPRDGKCLSMCVPIFLNGENRYAGSTTKFMFHRPWVKEKKFGSSIKEQARQRRYKARLNSKLSQTAWRFYNVHFNYSPIDRRWLKHLEEQWRVKGNDYWTTGEKLVHEKSNVITHLL